MSSVGQAIADNRLTISDVYIPQGGRTALEIGCEFETEFTAFELQLSLPEGLSLQSDEDGKPIVERTFEGSHVISGNKLSSNGNYKFTCYSTNENELALPISGILFRVTLQANSELAIGTSLNAIVLSTEFTRLSDSEGVNLNNVSFGIHITEFRTIIDENATTIPANEENANVRVKRAIKANQWSTICLPFAMTAAQVKTAFGNDVELADFNGYNTEEDGDGNIVAIGVQFNTVTAIEANHPYIIKVSQNVNEFTVDGVDIAPEEEPMVNKGTKRKPKAIIGSFVPMTIENGCLFLSKNMFWYSAGNSKMKGYRAYFDFNDLLTDFEDNYAESRIGMFFNEESTRVNYIINPSKRGDGSIYSLDGRKVKNMRKGVYVRDGKKIVITSATD